MKCKDGKFREFELTMAMTMQPYQVNVSGNVHGGEVMKLMDNVAGSTAIQYAKDNVVTARVDEMQFMRPISVGAFVTCTGKVVYVGTTSIEVAVTVEVEDLISHDEKKVKALTAYFTMVAVDGHGDPVEVPGIIPETDEEKRIFEDVKKRRDKYKKK